MASTMKPKKTISHWCLFKETCTHLLIIMPLSHKWVSQSHFVIHPMAMTFCELTPLSTHIIMKRLRASNGAEK